MGETVIKSLFDYGRVVRNFMNNKELEVYKKFLPENRMNPQEKFRRDMLNAGREPREYSGRNFYKGWAVEAEDREDLQQIIRETTVSLQWDNLGHGFIVYPIR